MRRFLVKPEKYWMTVKYGITEGEFNTMFAAQNGICPICQNKMSLEPGLSERRVIIDHDSKQRVRKVIQGNLHERKKCVRGLICHRCNAGIGMLGDSMDNLINAVIYLREYEERLSKEKKL